MASIEPEFETPEQISKSQRRQEIILLLVLSSVQFFSIVDFMVVMPLGPQLTRAMAINPEQFGWVVSSYTISAGLAGFLASWILDRFGRKRVYLTLYIGFLVGTLLCGFAFNYWTLLIARIVTGAFGGILGGMALAIIGDVIPEERRGRATGVLMSAFALASVMGVPLCFELGRRYGWQQPFLLLAALGLPFLVLAWVVLPPLRDHLHGKTQHPWKQLAETFSHPNHLRAFALTFVIMIGSFSIIPYLSLYLVHNTQVEEKDLTWVYVIGGVLSLVGAPVIGRLSDQFGKVRIYRIVAGIAAGFMLLITNMQGASLALGIGSVGTLMLLNSGRMVAGLSIVTGSVESRMRGGFMSANSAVQHLAAGLGAAIGGRIIARAADGSLLHYNRVGYLAALATWATLWIAGRVHAAKASPAPLAEPSLESL